LVSKKGTKKRGYRTEPRISRRKRNIMGDPCRKRKKEKRGKESGKGGS